MQQWCTGPWDKDFAISSDSGMSSWSLSNICTLCNSQICAQALSSPSAWVLCCVLEWLIGYYQGFSTCTAVFKMAPLDLPFILWRAIDLVNSGRRYCHTGFPLFGPSGHPCFGSPCALLCVVSFSLCMGKMTPWLRSIKPKRSRVKFIPLLFDLNQVSWLL